MRKKLLNVIAGVFFGMCVAVFFDIGKTPASKNLLVKNDITKELDKSFFGVTKVTDGDSIRVGDNKVRLLGIDAPEYSQKCHDAKNNEYNCGEVSKKFLYDLVNNKEVICHYSQKDIYNRFLGLCYFGEISLNEEILKKGMAVIYDYKNSSPKMDNLESEAKAAKIGIWQGSFQLPKEYRKSHKGKKHAE